MTKDHGKKANHRITIPHGTAASDGKHVVLVGCGAVGSAVAIHLGRMRGLAAVTLIDRDKYEERNLAGQDILPGDIGKPKAVVQARRLRHIHPGLRVEPIVGSIEDVPIGMLRSDVVLTGLDSRLARQVVAYRCWVLGIPWIDAGIEAEGSLAQATLYVPGEGRGCYLCNWSPRDFEVVEQTYPCEAADDRAAEPVATNAPSSLGALAASLLSIECEKLIRDPQMMRAEGFSILIDAENHQYYKTRIAYNDRCSAIWHGITPVSVASECSPAATFEGLFRARNADRGRKAPVDPVDGAGGRLRVFGQTFVTALTCPACATRRDIVCVGVSLKTNPAVTCQRCGHPMVTAGLDTAEELDCSRLPQEALRQPIESVGIRAGDILRVTLGEGEPFDVLVRPNRRRKT